MTYTVYLSNNDILAEGGMDSELIELKGLGCEQIQAIAAVVAAASNSVDILIRPEGGGAE